MIGPTSVVPPRRAAFIFVFITVLLDMLAPGIVVPVLPKLVVDFLAATGMGFLAGIPLLALWGFASPSALGLMSRQVGGSEQGRLQGANASIMGIANLLGPGLFAQTLALSIGGGALHLPGAAFLLAALILVLAIGVAWWSTRHDAHKPSM
jgi:hypothetical protein